MRLHWECCCIYGKVVRPAGEGLCRCVLHVLTENTRIYINTLNPRMHWQIWKAHYLFKKLSKFHHISKPETVITARMIRFSTLQHSLNYSCVENSPNPSLILIFHQVHFIVRVSSKNITKNTQFEPTGFCKIQKKICAPWCNQVAMNNSNETNKNSGIV